MQIEGANLEAKRIDELSGETSLFKFLFESESSWYFISTAVGRESNDIIF